MKPVGLQMWTVRESMAGDLEGTFEAVAKMGYRGVELWFREWPAKPDGLKRILEGTGLEVPSAHVPFLSLRDDFGAVAAFHRVVGTRYLTIPAIPAELRASDEDWKARVQEMVRIGRDCKDAGFQLAYHNHAFEFESTIGGVEVHDYIFQNVPEDLLKTELDTYFLASVGKDPADTIRRYGARMPMLHLKEKHKSSDYQNAEVGYGTIDWDSVFEAAASSAVEWYVVEQNCQERPELESVGMSLDYLKSRGLA
jgi:sugar phosphate isomerase/epimerase